MGPDDWEYLITVDDLELHAVIPLPHSQPADVQDVEMRLYCPTCDYGLPIGTLEISGRGNLLYRELPKARKHIGAFRHDVRCNRNLIKAVDKAVSRVG